MISILPPRFSTSAIGSVPFSCADEAIALIDGASLSAPFWPQLPNRHFSEGMIPQYSEGIPALRLDEDGQRAWFDSSVKMAELEDFYGKYLEEEPAHFAISEDLAAGFYAFERWASGRKWPFVKGQTTGPITFATGVLSECGEPLFGDAELRDAVVKALARKVQWQVSRLRKFASEGVIILVDEPTLAAYGSSSYIFLSEQNVTQMLGEVFEAISGAGGIPGIHVCGNSDWGMISRTGTRMINFDAYQYGNTLSLYPAEMAQFLEEGGCIAWGIVPTSEAVVQETAESLSQRLRSHLEAMERKGIDRELLADRSILTPSCGTGTMSPDNARRVFTLLGQVRAMMLEQEAG